ncbi:MAG: ABC transporter substrate-binding protein [Candidatus Paceibacterota bacterium]
MPKKIFIALVVLLIIVSGVIFFYSKIKKPESSGTQTATPGVTDTEVLLGSSSALSGHSGYLGTNYLHGAMARINQINEEGGINGRQIKVISYDDQYDPGQCVVNTQKLINDDKVFALFNYVGTPTGVKAVPIIEEAKIPLVGMFTGANAFREPLKKYVFNIRASYYQETEVAIEHFVNHLGLKKVAVFYQADAYGLDGLEGTKIALKKRGLELTVEGSYTRGTTDVEEAVKVISSSGAEAVVMVGTYSPTAKFVKLVKEKNPKMFFHSVSFVGPDEFVKDLGDKTENVFITQVVPPPNEYAANFFWAIDAYTQALKKYYPEEKPNLVGLEGYINAKVLIEGLRRSNRDLTRENFITALESIRDYSTGIGAPLNFSPTNHQGLEKVFLTTFKDGNFVFVTN